MATILIVDDEFSIVEALVEIISWEGFDTQSATNGRDGLDKLRKGGISLVVADQMMPVMNGVQMVHEMRADPALKSIPLVLMTAAPRALPPGDGSWDALLVKPFGVEEMTSTIRKLLATPRA